MSDVLDLSATLQLNTGSFASGLSGASSNMKKFGAEMLEKFGVKGLVTMGIAAGFALLGKKAYDFTKEAVKVGMEFDKAMSQVAATQGMTMDEMNQQVEKVDTAYGEFEGTLRDFAQFMGSNTAFSATESAEALNYMALAGYDAKESMEMLPNVLNLAAAGNMDLARASDMVTDAQTALGLSMDETNDLVDKMAETASDSNTSVEQLGDAMLRIGGQARSLKGGTTELTAAFGILADNGTKGAEAGTALRNVLLNIQSKKFDKEFGALGISAYDAEGNMRSLKDVFADMDKAMDGMSQKDRDKLIAKVFDRRSIKDVNALLGTSGDRWDELTEAIDGSEGAAQKMAETQLDNLAGDVTLAKSAFEGLQIAVSDKVTPALRGIVQFGTEMIQGISEAVKSGDFGDVVVTLITGLVQKLAEVAPMIVPAGLTLIEKLVLGMFDAFPKLLEGSAKAIQTFVQGMLASLPKIAGAALKLVVHLAKSLILNMPKLLSAVFKLAMAIPKGIVKGMPQMLAGGKKLIAKTWQGMKEQFPVLLSNLKKKASKIPEKVGEIVQDMVDAGKDIIQGLWNGVVEKWDSFVADIKAKFKSLPKPIRKLLKIGSPSKVFYEIGGYVTLGFALGIQDGWTDVQNAMDGMNDIVQEGVDDINGVELGMADGVFSDAITISLNEAFGQAMSALIPEMRDSMSEAMDGIRVTLDKREFGRMSRKAMQGAL